MNILGISAGYHDAAAAVVNTQGDILFAGHSERYSKKKNDAELCNGLLDDVLEYGEQSMTEKDEQDTSDCGDNDIRTAWVSFIVQLLSVWAYTH
jgi:predicted NodU family carbamoyl transferase